MKYTGIELLQAIQDGKIKKHTDIKVWFDDGIREYITTINFNGIDLTWESGTFYARHFYNEYIVFEIEKEKPTKIEELKLVEIQNLWDRDIEIEKKINELQKAVNYLLEKEND